MNKIKVNIMETEDYKGLEIPQYETAGAAGFDLRAAINKNVIIQPGTTEIITTGLIFELPDGFELQIRPRSGLAAKNGITVLNSPGTIDQDYKGITKIILHNTSQKPFTVERGMRIAQAVLAPVYQAQFVMVNEVSKTDRNPEGLGTTGTK